MRLSGQGAICHFGKRSLLRPCRSCAIWLCNVLGRQTRDASADARLDWLGDASGASGPARIKFAAHIKPGKSPRKRSCESLADPRLKTAPKPSRSKEFRKWTSVY